MIDIKEYLDKLVEIDRLETPSEIVDSNSESVFEVNLNTRKITVPQQFKETFAMQGEHKAETVWFAMNKYFDGVDLSNQGIVCAIQFKNALKEEGLLPIDYRQESDDDILLLGWNITYDVTKAAGPVELSLRFYKTENLNLTYNLVTDSIKTNIKSALFITSESENVIPPVTTLEELVNKIDQILDNNEVKPGNISYNDILDQPTLNGVTLKGKLKVGENLSIQYEQLDNLPTIDTELDLNSENAVQNKAISAKVENLQSQIDNYKVEVDETLSLESTSPVANKAIKTAIDDLQYQIDNYKVEVDNILDLNSVNPVQNKVIAEEINSIWAELDGLTFVPISIISFKSNPNIKEIGEVVNEISFNWQLNGTPLSLFINENEINANLNETTINQELKETTEFTLKAVDKKGNVSLKTIKLIFTNPVFYGVSDEKFTYDNEFLNSLNKNLQTSRENNINVDAEEGQYIYYAIPTSYGDCSFAVNGFNGGFTKIVSNMQYTNAYSQTTDYDIWKSDYANLGATNVVIS